jgi:serine protease Do
MKAERILVVLTVLLVSTIVSAADFAPGDVYRATSPAVVLIMASEGQSSVSLGTGSIITPDGMVVTNSHVIYNDSAKRPLSSVYVYLKPEPLSGDYQKDVRDPIAAKVVAYDTSMDLALLKINPTRRLATVSLGDPTNVTVGDPVAAIGHPEGGGLWTLTTGTISAIRKMGSRDVLQSQASLNPGNSGGPLLNAKGRLIGVNSFVLREGTSKVALEGLNFSIRSNTVKDWLAGKGVSLAYASDAASPPPPVPLPPAVEAAPPPQTTPKAEPPKPASPPPPPSREREFKGPNGEAMFGLPDFKVDKSRLLEYLVQQTRKKAENAFQELDELEAGDE